MTQWLWALLLTWESRVKGYKDLTWQGAQFSQLQGSYIFLSIAEKWWGKGEEEPIINLGNPKLKFISEIISETISLSRNSVAH